jgi:predicted nucleic acid-binding protein
MLSRPEIVAVILKAVWQRRLTANNASTKLATLLRLPIEYYTDTAPLERAYFLAMQLNRPTAYDAQYLDLAVAERLKCVF